MNYERLTAAPVREVLRTAERILMERIPLRKTAEDRHSIRMEGGDGAALIEAHRHGLDTVVTVMTDQLRTSRLDTEVQYFLTMLPYQPGDVKGTGDALPGGLSRSTA
jgi:hypothetical protein